MEENEMRVEDKAAEFLLLRLAEQGRPVEVVAQFIASYVVSAEGNDGRELMKLLWMVFARIETLLGDNSDIWPGLLPGGPGYEPLFELIPHVPGIPSDVTLVGFTEDQQHAIVYSEELEEWFTWTVGIFQNVSHPHANAMRPGMVMRVSSASLEVIANGAMLRDKLAGLRL